VKKALEVLKKYWGFDTFLLNQTQIIKSILNGNDTIALIPTGGGKSLCYQIPALISEGTCLVISPLIALISDQVQRLKSIGIKAEGLHSGLLKKEAESVLSKFIAGEIKLLYLSPEKLQSRYLKKTLEKINLSFIAIDEAHCISQWGYDFRPEYKKIHNIKELFPNIQINAFTATANSKTLKDIKQYLKLNKPQIIRGSFLKNNITFAVIKTEKKIKTLKNILNQLNGSGIIYMRSRKGTVVLSEILNKSNINSEYYHAGMTPENRKLIQANWLLNKTRVIISTTAFGMGIDKSNVRFVIHYDLPGSMEEYYQEAGRAGRDGQKSDAIIIYNQNDVNKLYKNNIEYFPSVFEIKNTFNNLIKYYSIQKTDKINLLKLLNIEDFYSFNKISNYITYLCIVELERYNAIELNIPLSKVLSTLKLNFNPNQLTSESIFRLSELKLIKASLLLYEGLFLIDSKINEELIANRLGITKSLVVKTLEELKSKMLINYHKQEQKLSITFKNTEKLLINEIEIKFRKKRLIDNIKTIISYLEDKNSCRQKNIVNYFDEKLKKNCKICDICLDANNNKYTKLEFIEFNKKLDNYKFDENTDLDDLLFLDSYLKRKRNIQIVKKIIASGKLSLVGNQIKKINHFNI